MAEWVEIAPDVLSEGALRGLAEEFVSREGTDYGAVERGFDDKVEQVLAQLREREVRIVFDPETERPNLVTARIFDQGPGESEAPAEIESQEPVWRDPD